MVQEKECQIWEYEDFSFCYAILLIMWTVAT